MPERKFINIKRGDCMFHPGEDFACSKLKGPFSQQEIGKRLKLLRDILPELNDGINIVGNGDGAARIPQMCQDCKFRLGVSPNGNPPESEPRK